MFNDVYIKDIYLSNKEKADKLSDEIMQLIRDEHITLVLLIFCGFNFTGCVLGVLSLLFVLVLFVGIAISFCMLVSFIRYSPINSLFMTEVYPTIGNSLVSPYFVPS